MQTPLDQALLVLFVGMFSVFIILGLIVISGQLLIRVVNQYFPVALEKKQHTPLPLTAHDSPDAKQLAVITAAVETFTHGKGRIVNVVEIEA